MRRAWREADEMGADTIYTWDHFYPLYGDPDGPHFEAIAMLGSMAEVTERAQIGALVICNSYRNPELLAHAHVTVDHASGGRAILGIGAGWFERDYDEYGYEFGTAPDRVRALRQALPRIKERLGKINPPPAGPLPILVAGSGEQVMLKLVAQYADRWHGFGDPARFRQKYEVLRRHCADIGRAPAEIEVAWGNHDGVLEHADDFIAAGVTELIVGVGGDGTGYDLGALRELIAWRDQLNAAAA
jgi:probable F420-dependent oxidoreductase